MIKIKSLLKLKYFEKDPYDDWGLHIIGKILVPLLIILSISMLFYCIWGWCMGYPAPA